MVVNAAFDHDGLFDPLEKPLIERALNAETDHPIGKDTRASNSRKTVMTNSGKLEIDLPRDCRASFDPQLTANHQRHFPRLDDRSCHV